MAAKWFVPRKTYEIALENNKKINEQRIKVSEENIKLQEEILELKSKLDKAESKYERLRRKLDKENNSQPTKRKPRKKEAE